MTPFERDERLIQIDYDEFNIVDAGVLETFI